MEIIKKYFPSITSLQEEQLHKLGIIFPEWNAKINLISRKDIPYLYERHILHSLSILRFYTFPSRSQILDIGTGGGFPGIPLAILCPDSDFTLVDSIGKKIMVVKNMIEELNLQNCHAENTRAEKIPGKYDYIVSRAVTNFDKFVRLFGKKLKKADHTDPGRALLYLKGGNFEEEIKPWLSHSTIHNLSDCFDEEFFETKKIIFLKL